MRDAPPAKADTKQRILAASMELFGRQGYTATGLKAIVASSGVPFGSLYHFFPGGKEELGALAIRTAGVGYRQLVESVFDDGVDVVTATDNFFAGAAAVLEATGYADACPIATVALEVANASEVMRQAAADTFDSWLVVLSDRFAHAGIAPERAQQLAIEMFCAIEGAFLLCRATRSTAALQVAGRAVVASVAAALDAPTRRRGA